MLTFEKVLEIFADYSNAGYDPEESTPNQIYAGL